MITHVHEYLWTFMYVHVHSWYTLINSGERFWMSMYVHVRTCTFMNVHKHSSMKIDKTAVFLKHCRKLQFKLQFFCSFSQFLYSLFFLFMKKLYFFLKLQFLSYFSEKTQFCEFSYHVLEEFWTSFQFSNRISHLKLNIIIKCVFNWPLHPNPNPSHNH